MGASDVDDFTREILEDRERGVDQSPLHGRAAPLSCGTPTSGGAASWAGHGENLPPGHGLKQVLIVAQDWFTEFRNAD